jgi:hypothetical protein
VVRLVSLESILLIIIVLPLVIHFSMQVKLIVLIGNAHLRRISRMPIRVNQSGNIVLFGASRCVVLCSPHQPPHSSVETGIDRILVLANYCTSGGADAGSCRTQQDNELVHGCFL